MMSPWLFNIYKYGVVREINTSEWKRGVEMIGQRGNVWRVNQLLHADDAVLMAESEEYLKGLVK